MHEMASPISSARVPKIFQRALNYAARMLKIDRFKDLQVDTIKSELRGQDSLVNLPTIYGKVCSFMRYRLPVCADNPCVCARGREVSNCSFARARRISPGAFALPCRAVKCWRPVLAGTLCDRYNEHVKECIYCWTGTFISHSLLLVHIIWSIVNIRTLILVNIIFFIEIIDQILHNMHAMN